MIRVMVTQEWAWFHRQLDFPKSKRIKAHILKRDGNRSYCGLKNRTDEGEVSLEKFIGWGTDACVKCLHNYRASSPAEQEQE